MSDLLVRRPGDVPPTWGPPPVSAAPQRPAAAVAAAVFGFQFAAGYLVLAALTVVGTFLGGAPAGAGAQVETLVGLVLLCALAGMLLAGGVAAIRGTGRVLLLVATGTETALVVAAGVLAVLFWPAASDLPSSSDVDLGRYLAIGAAVVEALVLAVLVLRLCLIAAPSVGRWLGAERAPRTGRGLLIGLLVPVGLLATVGVVAVFVAPAAETSGAGISTVAGAYQGDSDWGKQFYAGGTPLAPPAPGDPLFSATSDADAQACLAGAMSSCDDVFRTAAVGDVYEWYGSSCAGRLDHESDGGCVAELGERVTD